MRITLITERGYPYASSGPGAWCDRLVRAMPGHDFEVYTLGWGPGERDEGRLPANVRGVRTQALGGPAHGGTAVGGRRAREHLAHYRELLGALTAGDAVEGSSRVADRFASGLYGLAELARERGPLGPFLRSEEALRALEERCGAAGAPAAVATAGVCDLIAATELLERRLRPLSAPWYDEDGLAGADLCHAASGGLAGLPGLVAKRFFGTPLLVTEYGIQLRDAYVAGRGHGTAAPVRALLSAFHRLLAGEIYRRADLTTPGNTHNRRWQERCGADRSRIRTVYPGIDASRLAPAGDEPEDPTLVWVGRLEPAKDIAALLHAFTGVRQQLPHAKLRIIGPVRRGSEPYLAHCRTLAAQLFPDEAQDTRSVGESPVTFEDIGTPEVPTIRDAYAAGSVVVLSSIVEGFPGTLVEAMFCGRATVSTDAGAVREVIGGTGLVVPPRNPKALAAACLDLLEDRERRDRLGAAARARAQELFAVERTVEAFREIYLDLVSHCPARPAPSAESPFTRPAQPHVPGRWTSGKADRHAPRWAGEAAAQGGAFEPAELLDDGTHEAPAAPGLLDRSDLLEDRAALGAHDRSQDHVHHADREPVEGRARRDEGAALAGREALEHGEPFEEPEHWTDGAHFVDHGSLADEPYEERAPLTDGPALVDRETLPRPEALDECRPLGVGASEVRS
ncbi:GT4 family glycosyltransferase PelF [Wenjunlia tyrosinilytica]|uniref:D-inositol 3-phosphate glycosyltransferase n=1 Tax=Wenjunlia tyrosinilytica TaxID=1544741 RepID=A0A917ZLU2_9ACTN|nr:GT4 family glycosyltransferase PelF [Wenjunlia tyrosinilytica]GGO85811.1 transferase [Wenjunlia tyrosinilytica]